MPTGTFNQGGEKLNHEEENKNLPAENLIDSNKEELFDVLNPYNTETPAGMVCFKLFTVTSQENKAKMIKNIKINAAGNLETMGSEFFVLTVAPNGVDILERDGITFFLDDAGQREAEKEGYTLFETPAQADEFIDQFVGGNDETNKKIWNMMGIFGLYGSKVQTGYYDIHNDVKKYRSSFKQSYAILTKTYNSNSCKYGVKCGMIVEGDPVKKSIYGETWEFDAQDGYPVIVSRPIQK